MGNLFHGAENILRLRAGDNHNFAIREQARRFLDKRRGQYAIPNKRRLENTDFADFFAVHRGFFIGPIAQFRLGVFYGHVPRFKGGQIALQRVFFQHRGRFAEFYIQAPGYGVFIVADPVGNMAEKAH